MVGVEMLGYGGHWQLGTGLIAASAVSGIALAAHLRRHPHPLVEPAVMRVASFRSVMVGGTIARTAISAMPFLLPLLFQVGFGLNAFEAGMLYLASMLGNLGMKLVTTQALRRFGFRNVLVFNGALAAASIALCAVLSRETPVPLIVAIMLVCGMTRSMQFTGLTSMAFAEVPQPQMSSANTLFSTTQQMSMGLGIAVGAVVLHAAAAARGAADGAYQVQDFRITFLVVGLLALSSLLSFARLRRDAGAEVSGHRRADKPA